MGPDWPRADARSLNESVRAPRARAHGMHGSITVGAFGPDAATGASRAHRRAVLDWWLGALSRDEFVRTYYGRMALAQPAAVAEPKALFGWGDLASVLASGDAECFVVAAGEIIDAPAPKTHRGVVDVLRTGAGLFVRGVELAHPRVAELARRLDARLGAARVQIFVTSGGTHGFRWHYDDEHVFIVQTAGIKDYHLRENTVAAHVDAHPAAFTCIEREASPLQLATLAAGDVLYIPSRWWHMAHCRQTSLSLSIGVTPRAG